MASKLLKVLMKKMRKLVAPRLLADIILPPQEGPIVVDAHLTDHFAITNSAERYLNRMIQK